MLSRWFGVGRYVYNQTIEYLNKPDTKANWKAIKGDLLAGLPEWCKEVPYQIKSIAIKDACDAVKANKRKSQKSGDSFAMKFRSRKDPMQSCYIPKAAVLPQGVFYTILGNLRYGEQLPTDFGDCRLVCRYGKFYLCVPFESPRSIGDNQARVVALDPGVRNFITFFSENSCGRLGINANLKIQKLCFKLDDLISRMSKASVKQKKSMRKAEWRLKDRIQCLVNELHKKTARFLCDNFDVILLPTFETSQMVNKVKRKLTSKSARQMLTLSHFKFKQFIKHKAFETGKLVIDVCEAYTSKTVSWTGEIKRNLGGAKRIRGKDGQVMDRDLNGARGIFLRAAVDTPLLRDNLSEHFSASVSIS